MKTTLLYSLLFLLSLSACKKDRLDDSRSFSLTGPDGITNFTDLSSSNYPYTDHPFYQALEPQLYSFQIDGYTACCGLEDGLYAGAMANFTKVPSKNAGDITVGSYTFFPGSDNRYGDFGGSNNQETSPALMNNFGKETSFWFQGVSGELKPFSGTLYFPKLMKFTNINIINSDYKTSRNQGFTVSYEKDGQNSLPILLEVSWFADPLFDPDNASGVYTLVTNLFLIDDNGSISLDSKMFKDIPSAAKYVSVSLWRSNAAKDKQGIFFQVISQKGFALGLTD